MKDIKSFCKLFDLNIPVYEHFDYYINQLSKIDKYKNIKSIVYLYEEAEKNIDDIYAYKILKSNEIIDFLKSTSAFSELTNDNKIEDYSILNNNFKYKDGVKYLSIDLKSANWVSLKKYDLNNELGDTYSDLLNKFNVQEVFKFSKQFRQYIFGNINPKRQIKVQRSIMQDVVNLINDASIASSINIECIKNDEVICSFENIDDLLFLNNQSAFFSDKFSINIFTVETIEDFQISSILDREGNIVSKKLINCDGNFYFMRVKEYITHEDLDIRDLYFKYNNKIGVWLYEKLKVSICS